MNLFEPWILLRLFAGLTAVGFFVRGAMTSVRLLRHFDVSRATEGQLVLERHMELATTFVRVGAVVQVGALALTVLAADRLSHSVRGAMCAYGVFQENGMGFVSLAVTALVAFAAGVMAQLCAFDRNLRGLQAMRPIALATLFMAALAALDLGCTASFLLRIDLGAVASCCSTQLDPGTAASKGFASGSRVLASWGALIAVATSVLVGFAASRRPRTPFVLVSAAASLVAVPIALEASVLEVAPHAFEVPQHACPFCLLRADVLWIGYPLFGAILLAAVWAAGAGVAALVAGRTAADLSAVFARSRLRRGVWAWLVAAAIGIGPVVRHVIASGGRPLFP